VGVLQIKDFIGLVLYRFLCLCQLHLYFVVSFAFVQSL